MDVRELPNGDLEISVEPCEQVELQQQREELGGAFGTDTFMVNLLDDLTSNTGYEWVFPEMVGALTGAPMLGIYGEERVMTATDIDDYGTLAGRGSGSRIGVDLIDPIDKVWAFMSYMLTTIQDDLADHGRAFLNVG